MEIRTISSLSPIRQYKTKHIKFGYHSAAKAPKRLKIILLTYMKRSYIWSIVPHGLMWCLWRERNSRCFEDIERSIPDLKHLFFRTLLDWLFALQNKSFPSFFVFLDSCNFCFWFVVPLFTSCVLGCFLFDINISYYLSKKNEKKL